LLDPDRVELLRRIIYSLDHPTQWLVVVLTRLVLGRRVIEQFVGVQRQNRVHILGLGKLSQEVP
jgi:hypothetical protein